MAKTATDRKATAPPLAEPDDAALCQHELDARRENALRATRKRKVES